MGFSLSYIWMSVLTYRYLKLQDKSMFISIGKNGSHVLYNIEFFFKFMISTYFITSLFIAQSFKTPK